MNEYIEREAAIDAVLDVFYDTPDIDLSGEKLEAAIINIQSADVELMKRGRWEEADWFEPDCHSFGTIRTPKAALRCSNCKHCFKKELLWKDNYCPNCGARMTEEV